MTPLIRRAVRIKPPTNRVINKESVKSSVTETFAWPNGTKGAVSLTYDDGLSSQLDLVAPELESMGLRGTFYPHIASKDFLKRTEEWGELAKRGHELGNHMVFHPCLDNHALDPSFDLADYSETRWQSEAELANWVLGRLDGRTEHTFGNTCWDNWIGSGENRICIEKLVPLHFAAARGEMSREAVNPHDFNQFNLGTRPGDGYKFKELRKIITDAVASGRWLIFTFHCVGRNYPLFIDEGEHRQMIKWLSDEAGSIWVKPLKEVSEFLIKNSGKRL